MDNKTRTIIVDQSTAKHNTKKLNTSSIKTDKIYIKSTAEGQPQEQIKVNTNPYASYFPVFYVKELKHSRNALIGWILSAILIVLAMGLAAGFSIENSKPDTYWLLVLYILPVLIFFPIFFIHINRYISMKNEAKTINFKDQKTLSTNTVNLYKRLKVAYLNANWFCSLGYISCVAAFICLIIAVVAVGVYTDATGTKDFSWNSIFDWKTFSHNPLSIIFEPTKGQEGWFIGFIVILGILFTCIGIHIYTITTSYVRIARIENFYNSFIVTNEEIEAYKKKTNRRDMIVFCVCLLILGLIIWSAIKGAKNKKNNQQVVIAK